MRTLLLNPPSCEGFDGGAGSRYQACREIRSFWYPTWLAYPAGMIPRSRLVDAPADGLDADDVLALAEGYDLIAMSTSAPTVSSDVAFAGKLKERYPEVEVGLVGPHTMALPLETLSLSEHLDFVTTGEYEHTLLELANGAPYHRVKGIAYRSQGRLMRTQDRPLIENLDTLPFVSEVYARDLVIERYAIGYLLHPYVSLYTGRGCQGRCTYCLWPQTISGHAYRVRSLEHVREEMLLAKRLFPQAKEFFFDDDTLTEDPKRIQALSRLLKPLGLTWSCNARANVDRETLKIMKESGLRLLTVGFESGNQQILNNIKKGIRLDQARDFMKTARELGILVHGAFILGLPGETRETIEETMRFAKELDPYSIQVSLAAPYPGTELYTQGLREGWLAPGSTSLTVGGIQNAVLAYKDLPREYIFEAIERFYRSYYLRPGPILRILKDMLKDRHEFTRRMREGAEFFSFMAKRKDALES